MRARVFSEVYAGRVWVYEIYDPALPEGHQIRSSGMRPTWREALVAALVLVSR